jgi:hypothetical protein
VLAHIGVETDVRYVEGPRATPENVADLAWHDWVDKMPLVVALDDDQVVAKWNGDAIRGGFTPAVRSLLAARGPVAPGS